MATSNCPYLELIVSTSSSIPLIDFSSQALPPGRIKATVLSRFNS
jgi:hypothetical protein